MKVKKRMAKLVGFDEAIAASDGNDRALLLGNGFSANYFSYENLFEKSGLEEDSSLARLFKMLYTTDFEAVVSAIEGAALVERAYGNASHADELKCDAQFVREALVKAVNETHPSHREDLEFEYESSAAFLGNFSKVFTLNYDLLLYWVNLEKGLLRDGFGKGVETANRKFRKPFAVDAYCEIYNLHGGLHLFQTLDGDAMKALDTGDGVISTITQTILDDQMLPMYVAEGSTRAKLKKINSSFYLRHCYEKLHESVGAFFVYGHSAAANDAHIYQALFSSQVQHIYFGIYRPNKEKIRAFDGELARYQKLSGKDITYSFYDAESANVWNDK